LSVVCPSVLTRSRHAGLLPAIGWKHGRWLDSVMMVRSFGAGASEPPD
jgi:phosphinothricin acetyltransferase